MAFFSVADRRRAGAGRRGRLLLRLALVAAAPIPAGAQEPATSACSYDRCALRREVVFFGQRVLAGTQGRVVARSGFSGFRLDSVLAGSPRALAEARIHQREAGRGGVLMLVGGVLGGIGVVRGAVGDESSSAVTALVASGAVASVVGGWRLQISDRALNRALWWYNRDLPR